jgi:polyhydroxyalkanoate synthase
MHQNQFNTLEFNKFHEAIIIYQTGLSLLLMKLHSNQLLPEVQNNILTRFFAESSDLLLDKPHKILQSFFNPKNYIDHFRDSYTKMLNLSNTYLTSWQKSTSDFINQYTKQPSLDFNYQENFLKHFQSYNIELFKFIEENISQTLDHWIGHDNGKETLKFLSNEFKKLFNYKNIPWLQENVDPDMFYRGAKMFMNDVINSPDGYFLINTVDSSEFTLGQNIAATKGKVVFKNELVELICYESTTENIHKTPILIVTAWINKYYVLDLDPQYSYVKWLVDNGYKVFITSWINPDKTLSNKSLYNYMNDGILAILDNIKKLTQVDEVNCIGYCMGGTLLSITAAYLGIKGNKSIKSITLLATLTDFNQSGPVKIFITDEMLDSIERYMEKQGYISGYDMFNTFSIIKSDDMIWYYFKNKYLLGKESKAIDVLYWNSDSTRIPSTLHKQCLRDLYQSNLLSSGEFQINNTKINLANIKCPVYSLATQDDHIAPWESVYKGINMFGSTNKRFILSKSGHVAAVINHPDKKKYGYWFDQIEQKKHTKLPDSAQSWLDKTQYKDGSWWLDWHQWMVFNQLNGVDIKSYDIPIESVIADAPGSYIKIK